MALPEQQITHPEQPKDFAHDGTEVPEGMSSHYLNSEMKNNTEDLRAAGAELLAPDIYEGAQMTVALMGSENQAQGVRTFKSAEVKPHADGSYGRPHVSENGALAARPNPERGGYDHEKEPDFRFGGRNAVPVNVEVVDHFEYYHVGHDDVEYDDKTRRTMVRITPISGTMEGLEQSGPGKTEIPAMLPALYDKTPRDIELAVTKTDRPISEILPRAHEQITEASVELSDNVPNIVRFTRQTGNPENPSEEVRVLMHDLLADEAAIAQGKNAARKLSEIDRKTALAIVRHTNGMFEQAQPQLEAIKSARQEFAAAEKKRIKEYSSIDKAPL